MDLRDAIKENIDRAINVGNDKKNSAINAIAELDNKISEIESTLKKLTENQVQDKSEIVLQVVNEKFANLEERFSSLEEKLSQLLSSQK